MLDKIAIAINLLGLVAGVGLSYYATNMIAAPPIDEAAHAKKMMQTESIHSGAPVKMKKMTVNLYSPGKRLRFLDVEMGIVPIDEELRERVKEESAIISDTLIDVTSFMSPAELQTLSGRILLEERLKTQVHQKLQQKLIKDIFFSRFVVQ